MTKLPPKIGPYTLQNELGRGGMAVVHKAVDTRNGRAVALKVLPLEYAHNPTLLKRFQREGTNTQRLEHRHIVHVFEVGAADNYHFIAMEIATNGTLSDRMKRQSGPLPEQEVITILQQVAAGLDYAHSQGYLHRDIKPSNILFADDGRAILGDFGVAKDLNEQDSGVTRAGGAVGTPAFMSPEQARGDTEISRRSDVYSLGVVAYYMLTGRMPFEADNEFGLLRKIIEDQPPSAERFNPRIHPGTAYILKLVLDKNPDTRYSTAGTFASQLAMNLSLLPRQRPVPPQPKPTPHTPKTPIQQRTPTPNTPTPNAGPKTPSAEAKAATPRKEVQLATPDGTEVVASMPDKPQRRRGTTVLTSLVFLSAAVGLVWTIWSTAGHNGQEETAQTATQASVAVASPTPTSTSTSTPTPTPTSTPSPSPSPTADTTTTQLASPVPAEGASGAAAGSAPTTIPTPTETNAPTYTPTPSTTPSATSTIQATATPSSTDQAAPGTVPTRRPTSTPAKPTPTNTPTITPTPLWSPTAEVAGTPPTRVPTNVPTRAPVVYDFALVQPAGESLINYGRETFEWHTNYPLRSNQGLELVFWPRALGPGGWMNGRSPVGAQTSGINETVWRYVVSLTSFEDAQSEFFRPGEYYWGVLVVDTSPAYKRIALLNGAYRTFIYNR